MPLETTNTIDSLGSLTGRVIYDGDGAPIGTVSHVYLDDETDQPTWVLVDTGRSGAATTLVPLDGSSRHQNGVRVAYNKAFVEQAPKMDADGDLSEAEETVLYSYYGIETRRSDADAIGVTGRTASAVAPSAGDSLGSNVQEAQALQRIDSVADLPSVEREDDIPRPERQSTSNRNFGARRERAQLPGAGSDLAEAQRLRATPHEIGSK